MNRIIPIVAALVLLSGCMSKAQIAERDRGKCQEYGFTQGTDAFANCMMRWDHLRVQVLSSGGPVTCNTFGPTTTCY